MADFYFFFIFIFRLFVNFSLIFCIVNNFKKEKKLKKKKKNQQMFFVFEIIASELVVLKYLY